MDIKETVTGLEPITLDDVKEYCKIDYESEDSLIVSLITAVRERIEKFTGLALVEKTIEVFYDYLPEQVKLPYPEHDAITEVQVNGTVSTDYTKKGISQFIIKPNAAYIIGTDTIDSSLYVKYTTTGKCPEAVKIEMLRLIDEKYRNRGNTLIGSTSELSENCFSNLAQFCLE